MLVIPPFLVSKWLQVNGRNKMSYQQFHIKVKNVMAFKHILSNLVNNYKILRSSHSFVFLLTPTIAWSIIDPLAAPCINSGLNSTLLILTLLR